MADICRHAVEDLGEQEEGVVTRTPAVLVVKLSLVEIHSVVSVRMILIAAEQEYRFPLVLANVQVLLVSVPCDPLRVLIVVLRHNHFVVYRRPSQGLKYSV